MIELVLKSSSPSLCLYCTWQTCVPVVLHKQSWEKHFSNAGLRPFQVCAWHWLLWYHLLKIWFFLVGFYFLFSRDQPLWDFNLSLTVLVEWVWFVSHQQNSQQWSHCKMQFLYQEVWEKAGRRISFKMLLQRMGMTSNHVDTVNIFSGKTKGEKSTLSISRRSQAALSQHLPADFLLLKRQGSSNWPFLLKGPSTSSLHPRISIVVARETYKVGLNL